MTVTPLLSRYRCFYRYQLSFVGQNEISLSRPSQKFKLGSCYQAGECQKRYWCRMKHFQVNDDIIHYILA